MKVKNNLLFIICYKSDKIMAKLIFTTQETVLEIMDDNEFISFEMKTKIENNTQFVYLNKDDVDELINFLEQVI